MPYYKYECECGNKGVKFFILPKYFNDFICPECGSKKIKKIPSLPYEPTVFETMGTFQKRKVLKNIKEIMRKRAHNHMRDRGEMSEIIEREGVKVAKNKGFLTKSGKKIKSIDEK